MAKKDKLHIIPEPEYSRRKKQKRCVVAFCQNRAGNNGKFRFCYKHHRQHQKFNNPLRYWFDVLRQNARRREKEFTLTLKEFEIFCNQTGYLELKSKNAGGASIDRIDNEKGYSLDNIQMLTLSQNSRKQWIDLKLQFGYYPTPEELEELYNNQPPPRVNADGIDEDKFMDDFFGKDNTENDGLDDCPF